MVKKQKLKSFSISVFFPCFNDAGTIASMVELATHVLKRHKLTFEIIVVNDGSWDESAIVLKELSLKNKYLKVITHKSNMGYGAALISGFSNSKFEYVFYTDGDFQYNVWELSKFLEKVDDKTDVIQGYKIKRHDPWYRILIGEIYNSFVRQIFSLNIRDVDCDFRLIKRSFLKRIHLIHASGVITVELVTKLEQLGANFIELPVHHYFRSYGTSQFFNYRRLLRVAIELLLLWRELIYPRWKQRIIFLKKRF